MSVDCSKKKNLLWILHFKEKICIYILTLHTQCRLFKENTLMWTLHSQCRLFKENTFIWTLHTELRLFKEKNLLCALYTQCRLFKENTLMRTTHTEWGLFQEMNCMWTLQTWCRLYRRVIILWSLESVYYLEEIYFIVNTSNRVRTIYRKEFSCEHFKQSGLPTCSVHQSLALSRIFLIV